MQNPEDIGHERLPSYFYRYKVKQKKINCWKSKGARAPKPHSWRRQCGTEWAGHGVQYRLGA